MLRSVLLGYGLLIISLVFDGLMGLKEKMINHEVHHNPNLSFYKNILSWEYMRLFSFYSIVFCLAGLSYQFLTGDLSSQIVAYIGNKDLMINLVSYSFASSLGQVFIFQFLEKYGPLTLSIITGVRKILSISLSIIFFGKSVSLLKIISLILGTTVIGWEVLEKTTSKGGHGHGHGSVTEIGSTDNKKEK